MGKCIQKSNLTMTLSLSECTDGFWLYDVTRGMNLAIRSKSSIDAFVEALTYYQVKLKITEQKLFDLEEKVDSFINQFKEEDN